MIPLLVLAAALLHSAWNALLKPAADRAAVMLLIAATSVAMVVPALLLPVPRRAAWLALGVSGLLHLLYNQLLIRAYRHGELNQVYPIARGSAPPIVAVCAVLFAGDHLSALQVAGVAALSGGLLLGAGRSPGSSAAVHAALLTGASIAAYTVVDGIGVRRAGTAPGYAAWLMTLHGTLTVGWLLATRKRLRRRQPAGLVLRGVVAGTLSILAYTAVLYAQTQAPLAVVAALRETSVVFAAGLGALLWREALPVRRLVAAGVIAGGAAVLALG